jgi:tRNA pseudouridine13 synthase
MIPTHFFFIFIDGQHLAIKVEFTLGTSQYATMALREIMRAETSSQAQSTISHD